VPTVTDKWDKLFLDATRLRNKLNLEENCLLLNKIDFELAILNRELAELRKRLEKN